MALGRFGVGAKSEGKRGRTRARLMDAAAIVFARYGVEGGSVNLIAQTAEVANGTFYNHFTGKDDIAATVAFDILREIIGTLGGAMAGIADPAERFSFGTRQFIELAALQPDWGLALFRAVWSIPELRRDASLNVRADIQAGVDSGAFQVEVDDFLINAVASMNMMAVFSRVRDDAGGGIGSRTAEMQLRMLGVSPEEARRIAHLPLPTLNFRTLGGTPATTAPHRGLLGALG
jgi:AcrR family transcriptional regulator